MDENELGRWAIRIPESAMLAWTQWEKLAYDLTLNELQRLCPMMWSYRVPTCTETMCCGGYPPPARRLVAEALAHLVALAQVRGYEQLTLF